MLSRAPTMDVACCVSAFISVDFPVFIAPNMPTFVRTTPTASAATDAPPMPGAATAAALWAPLTPDGGGGATAVDVARSNRA